jgi:hypothetical protein
MPFGKMIVQSAVFTHSLDGYRAGEGGISYSAVRLIAQHIEKPLVVNNSIYTQSSTP